MNELEFWGLLDKANEKRNCSWQERYSAVASLLSELSRESLVDFTTLFSKVRVRAFKPGVICGAHMIYEGSLSEESFLDFSDCLVALGSEAFEEVIKSADVLFNYLELAHCPSMFFWKAAVNLYDSKKKRKDLSLEEYLPLLCEYSLDDVLYNGKRGLAIASRENCEDLTPILAARFGNATWGG